MKHKPIGIFDSGIGGLTVFKAIKQVLPYEDLIYLGDTARVPYGTRGKEIITKFALEMTQFLLKQDIKFLIVACNTVSATCLKDIQTISKVEVLGVIEPSVKKIVKTTKNKKVGIVGTRATINSRVYEKMIKKIDKKINALSLACPLFVPIIEEGLMNSNIAKITAEKYLSPFQKFEIDTLHLGCTHYPLLKKTITKVLGRKVNIIDSAEPTAYKLKEILLSKGLLNNIRKPQYKFYFTDISENLIKTASSFLGNDEIKKIEKFDIIKTV